MAGSAIEDAMGGGAREGMAASGGVAVKSDCPEEGAGKDVEPKLTEMTAAWARDCS